VSVKLPKNAADWEGYLATLDTPEKMNAAMADTGESGFKANLKSYVSAETAERADMANQVKEYTQSALVDLFRENGADVGSAKSINAALLAGAKAAPQGDPSNAPGAALNGKFKNVGEFINAIWNKRQPGLDADLDAKLSIVAEYSEKIPDAGGFLVPEEFRQQLLALELETSIVKPRATVIPMSSASLTFPTVDATSNVSSVFGGIVVYRKAEGEEFVDSQAKFGRVKLDPTKQTALAYVNNEVIRDAGGALSAFMNQRMPQAMAWFEDVDYIGGTGAGEPLGALAAGNPGLITVTKETGQAAATIVWENVLTMYSRLLPSSIDKAVWIASPDTFKELATMALSVGTGGSAVWLMDGRGKPVLTLLGLPVIRSEKTPGYLGQAGDLSLVDFSFYLVGQRDTMTMDTSEHVRFTRDQTTIRVIQRNDGRPWLASPITPKNGGPTLSPFISLGARA
jgi:HK97 family phage major capsid protein